SKREKRFSKADRNPKKPRVSFLPWQAETFADILARKPPFVKNSITPNDPFRKESFACFRTFKNERKEKKNEE
ncbi:MAG: hypothetical protein J5938_02390, partial [Clostridia bacterium]|nr:hypothetical protein [Clostridia bacterium]